MFTVPTAFVLGAGASWHYGYPTGEQLVGLVIEKSKVVGQYCQQAANMMLGHLPVFLRARAKDPEHPSGQEARGAWSDLSIAAQSLATRLERVNPTLIDYFLAQNPDLHEIAKIIIAMVLFDCEATHLVSHRQNQNRYLVHYKRAAQGLVSTFAGFDPNAFNDDWLRFVLYRITSNCKSSAELNANKLTFVTFNYDVSLEKRLSDGLRNIAFFAQSDVDEFFSETRFIHVYGQIRQDISHDIRPVITALPSNVSPNSDDRELAEARTMLDFVKGASDGIHTIDGEDKTRKSDCLVAAREALSRAEHVYVLGYGFDSSNNERIGLSALKGQPDRTRRVYFTNFGSLNRISKSAARLFFDNPHGFLPPNGLLATQGRGDALGHYLEYTWEMSTKNVYDALEQDFESLEN